MRGRPRGSKVRTDLDAATARFWWRMDPRGAFTGATARAATSWQDGAPASRAGASGCGDAAIGSIKSPS